MPVYLYIVAWAVDNRPKVAQAKSCRADTYTDDNPTTYAKQEGRPDVEAQSSGYVHERDVGEDWKQLQRYQ